MRQFRDSDAQLHKPPWVLSRVILRNGNEASEGASHRLENLALRRLERAPRPLPLNDRNYRRDRKRQKFLDLVEQYYSQIRSGCESPQCQTPTCHTFKLSRTGRAPYRRPTPSSARAMALLLASADDPYQNLCPHLSNYATSTDKALPAATHLKSVLHKPRRDRPYLDCILDYDETMREMAAAHCQDAGDSSGQGAVSVETERSEDTKIFDGKKENSGDHEGNKLDKRSFTQMLFNTSSWKMAKVVRPVDGAYKLMRPPSPFMPSTPIEGILSEAPNRDSTLSVFLSPSQQSSIETIADRIRDDIGTVEALFDSFRTRGRQDEFSKSGKPCYTIEDTVEHFSKLQDAMNSPELIFWSMFEDCAVAYWQRGDIETRTLSHTKASHVICVCFSALLSSMPRTKVSDSWVEFLSHRASGQHFGLASDSHLIAGEIAEFVGYFHEPKYFKLIQRLLRIIASRCYVSSPSKHDFITYIINFLGTRIESSGTLGHVPWNPSRVLLEWARTVLQACWDGDSIFSWSSDVGCSIEFMKILFHHREELLLSDQDFLFPYLAKRLDTLEFPVEWMKCKSRLDHEHLLSFRWLFSRSTLVTFFRVINRSKMLDVVFASATLRNLVSKPERLAFLIMNHRTQIDDRLGLLMSDFLTLTIRRDNILNDALDELVGRVRKEVARPLKIRMGMQEGEEGVDLGGIQQEFFRLALGQALDPLYGIFSLDETTRMSWFYPSSLVPQRQKWLVGVLVGLAVYNGITLSVTFPLAFYRKLLGMPLERLEHIEDGWPVLARGLRSLLEYSESDVADVFMRSYVFSTESNGKVWSIDMMSNALEPSEEWPPKPNRHRIDTVTSINSAAESAPMVTNENRVRFVEDYIYWLTDRSVREEFDDFAHGFFACIDKKALSLFSPEDLKHLVEGTQDIDVEELREATTYEGGFEADQRQIKDFWEVVRNFSPAELRKLLEFVTASDRVPVRGVRDIAFSIVKNGVGDERLPTALTCFSRLLIPVYSSKKVLEEKLRQAIDNSLGFGTP